MSVDHMILAVSYKAGHLWPVHVSEKLDGVAGRFVVQPDGSILALSRQNEKIVSVQHICDELEQLIAGRASVGTEVIGELTVDGVPKFKDASGSVRSFAPDVRIALNIFDYVPFGQGTWDFDTRLQKMMDLFGSKLHPADGRTERQVRRVLGGYAQEPAGLEILIKAVYQRNPHAEGVMIRPAHGENSFYRVGRSKGFMRIKAEPTVDLRVAGFKEAVSKDTGEGLGMVGRINCLWGDVEIGCGPGKMTHDERKAIWENPAPYIGKIGIVKYKPDDSYGALREPTFQAWHPDKTEPDIPMFIEVKDAKGN